MFCERFNRLENKILAFIKGNKKKRKSALQLLWKKDRRFREIFREIKGRTLVTPDRCHALYQNLQKAGCLEGDIAEVGVYKGGTAKIILKTIPSKKVHLFDTFEGMPRTDKNIDKHNEGDFSDTSLENVREFLRKNEKVISHKGFFPKTASSIENCRFCFVHVDVDIYQSVKDCLEFFYKRMVSGGVMIFDDYEWKDTPGVKKAIDEFLVDKPERQEVTALYQCMIVKR